MGLGFERYAEALTGIVPRLLNRVGDSSPLIRANHVTAEVLPCVDVYRPLGVRVEE